MTPGEAADYFGLVHTGGGRVERLTGKVHHLGGLDIREIDGSSRTRPRHPKGRGSRIAIVKRLTSRNGRRRYRGR
jgi:hypothetical protein